MWAIDRSVVLQSSERFAIWLEAEISRVKVLVSAANLVQGLNSAEVARFTDTTVIKSSTLDLMQNAYSTVLVTANG